MSGLTRRRPTSSGSSAAGIEGSNVEAAVEAALRILRGAAQTEVTLRRRLETRGYDRRTAQAAAAEAVRLGYVDDGAFALSLVERRTRRGYGVGTMRAELRSRGVGDLRIDDALSGLEPGAEAASAAALARRLVDRERGRRDADARGAERVAGALARRGFDVETVRAAVRAAWKEPLPDE